MVKDAIPIGYQALVNRFNLQVIPYYRSSFASSSIKRKVIKKEGNHEIHLYPIKFLPPEPLDALIFALRYEGLSLEILKALFKHISKKEIEDFIPKLDFKKEARKLWFLYETLTGFRCHFSDRTSGKYDSLLDSKKYYTSRPIKSPRHRILNNLLGTTDFCPIVRKTKILQKFEKKNLPKQAKKALRGRPPKWPLFFGPRGQKEALKRHRKFVALIKEASHKNDFTKSRLIYLHNKAAGRNGFETDFRQHQNYLAFGDLCSRKKICRISPQPKDVPRLMQGLIDTFQRMKKSSVHPVILASVISFGFSLIHPFGDGNGRVQLFLLYDILLHSHFRAVITLYCPQLTQLFYEPSFKNFMGEFDRALLSFTKYTLHRDSTLTVYGETADFFRTIDYTKMAEFVFFCLDKEIIKK